MVTKHNEVFSGDEPHEYKSEFWRLSAGPAWQVIQTSQYTKQGIHFRVDHKTRFLRHFNNSRLLNHIQVKQQ
jgi:hypothetical protein